MGELPFILLIIWLLPDISGGLLFRPMDKSEQTFFDGIRFIAATLIIMICLLC